MSKPDTKQKRSLSSEQLDEALDMLEKNSPELTELNLSGIELRQDQIDRLKLALPSNTQLNRLSLGKKWSEQGKELIGMNDDSLSEIMESLQYNQSVTELDLSDFLLRGKLENDLIKLFEKNKTICHLGAERTGIQFQNLQKMLNSSQTLTELSLTTVEAGDKIRAIFAGVTAAQQQQLQEILNTKLEQAFVSSGTAIMKETLSDGLIDTEVLQDIIQSYFVPKPLAKWIEANPTKVKEIIEKLQKGEISATTPEAAPTQDTTSELATTDGDSKSPPTKDQQKASDTEHPNPSPKPQSSKQVGEDQSKSTDCCSIL